MAIVSHGSLNKTVANIAERNSLPNKINNMVVIVQDAIDDSEAGVGIATYRYNALTDSWILEAGGASESAHKLFTPRKINSIDFDGTIDINIDAIPEAPKDGKAYVRVDGAWVRYKIGM